MDPFEDVFPVEKLGDIPASDVCLPKGKSHFFHKSYRIADSWLGFLEIVKEGEVVVSFSSNPCDNSAVIWDHEIC